MMLWSSCGRLIQPAIELPADTLTVEALLAEDTVKVGSKPNYWQYIHHPSRLDPIATPFTLDGRIWIAAYNPYDGDIHYAIKPSRQQSSGLGITRRCFRGFIIAEIICAQGRRKSVIDVCGDCGLQFPVRPHIFQRVSVTGTLAIDKGHDWYEIHPVTSVRYLNPRTQKRMDRRMAKKGFPEKP